ncbi:MAG: NADH:flavin oxidoreductase [Dehalococcoidia bacterium]|nr:NADH:flavin oxidoreductase [Dehalococcoidia bacterium]
MKFENLLKPVKIGSVKIKNRISMAPCNVHFSDGRGYPTDADTCYYAARAKGGIGLTIVGAVMANREDAEAASLVIPRLDDVSHVGPFQEIVESIHEWDSVAFIQLVPGLGRQSRLPRAPVMVPSIVPMEKPGELEIKQLKAVSTRFLPMIRGAGYGNLKEMTIADIARLVENYGKSTLLALYAGFDGIEIHAPHGYLVHQFLSPRTNKRTDRYGGPIENRMRFLMELIDVTRATVEDRCAVGVRIAANEHMPGGMTVEDVGIITKECVKRGVDYIHLSDGCMEARKYFFPEEESDHLLDEAKQIRQGLGVPLITPSVHDPAHGDAAIAAGKTDMISLGRQLMADPDWANKVMEGRVGDINRCRRDATCLMWLFTEGRVRCAYNPNLGRERFMPEYWPQKIDAKLPPSLMKKGK